MMNVEEAVRETVSVLNNLKPCKGCIHSNDDCTWCHQCKTKINPYQYGCKHHMTDEEAVRKLAEIEFKKYCNEFAKMTLDMDVMGYTINAASMILEKIDKELERSYNSIKEKTDDSVKKHLDSKKNRDRLRKAYAQMRFNANDMRNTFDRYVEYFFTHQFTDEQGKYNVQESDKNLSNSGIITKVIKLFVDRALDNPENAQLIVNFMLSLKGSGIYNEKDFDTGIIRS